MLKDYFSVVNKNKNNINSVVLVTSLFIGTATYASPYVGLDVVYSKTPLKKDFGGNIFSKKFTPGVNLFAGYMFNENFGAEAGFEVNKKTKKTVDINTSESIFGIPFNVHPNIRNVSFNSSIQQYHPYIGFLAKNNFLNENNSIGLMVGASLSHINAKSHCFQSNRGSMDIIRNFSKTKIIPIIKAQVEHNFNNNIGLRAYASWKNTSSFKMNSKENNNSKIKLKNSFNIGVGGVYTFL